VHPRGGRNCHFRWRAPCTASRIRGSDSGADRFSRRAPPVWPLGSCKACCAGAAALHSAASPLSAKFSPRVSQALRWISAGCRMRAARPRRGRHSNASSRGLSGGRCRHASPSPAAPRRTAPDTSALIRQAARSSPRRQLRLPMPPRHHHPAAGRSDIALPRLGISQTGCVSHRSPLSATTCGPSSEAGSQPWAR
jgi:hypothetical protein